MFHALCFGYSKLHRLVLVLLAPYSVLCTATLKFEEYLRGNLEMEGNDSALFATLRRRIILDCVLGPCFVQYQYYIH